MTFNLAESVHRLDAVPRPQLAIAPIAAILLIGVIPIVFIVINVVLGNAALSDQR